MPSPNDNERLLHIKQATDLIIEYTSKLNWVEFEQDRKSQLSVERLLEILGEAANHLSPELKSSHPKVPWRQITDLRNIISHEYFQVKVELIWQVATNEIPALAEQIDHILKE
jgi:uncharacterized protein with HEPN domain